MSPDEFIAEVYRRGAVLMPGGPRVMGEADFFASANAREFKFYRAILPGRPDARIAEIGSGDGGFLATCHALGYTNVTAFDFRAAEKFAVITAKHDFLKAENFNGSIAAHFALRTRQFDVIHFSHVIEHVPKYDLIETMDALCGALKDGGLLVVRTPNMHGPTPLSSLYCTLAHEYGFTGSNLSQLLQICGFGSIECADTSKYDRLVSRMLRRPFVIAQKIKTRLFGITSHGGYGSELVLLARPRNRSSQVDLIGNRIASN